MKINLKGKEQIIKDMLINIIGTGLPLIVLQMYVYPYLAKSISPESYGAMQSIMSLIYLTGGSLGGALSTSRLICDYKYKEQSVEGDYPILVLICMGLLTVVMPVLLSILMPSTSWDNILLITIVALLNFTTLYYEVGFRIQLNYRAIFINKVLCGIGYLVGFFVFNFTLRWQFIFICSLLSQTVFCMVKTGLLKEKIAKTKLMRSTVSSFTDLSIANLLSKAHTYFDKLLLYPLLGGEAVSIYFAANIFGKLVLQVLEPITNVVLSYISKEKKIRKQLWKAAFILGTIFSSVMYVICRLISRPILQFLYPQWVEQAIQLVPIATLSLCISTLVDILHPFTLKALKANKQIIFFGTGLLVYIICTMLLYVEHGLIGCCYALLISNSCKLLIMVFFCVKSVHEES